MKRWPVLLAAGAMVLTACLLIPPGAEAQEKDYPNQPITFLVPFGPGGASDLAARAVAKYFPAYMGGQQLVVVNKPGAGGAVAVESLVRSKPDGYTMLSASIGSNTLTPAFTPKLPYKYDEMTFICRTQINPAVIVVKAESPWKSLPDLVAALKKAPGNFMYGTSGVGTMMTVGANKLFKLAGIDPKAVTMIPFNSGNEQVVALLGGNIHFSYMNLIEPIAQLRAGKLRALAVGPKRVEEFGTVPSFAEAGFPGLDVLGWRGVVGPPNLPAGIVSKWVQAMDKICKDKGWVETVTKLGDVPGFLGPKEFKDMVDKEYSEMKEFAKAYGIN